MIDIVEHWRASLSSDEWKTYTSMTDEQKHIVNLAVHYRAGTEIAKLEEKLTHIKGLFPWHRGDADGLDVPVLQHRYDALRATVQELEDITSWKQQRMASDTQYLPFVDEHYWYEPERGPVIYAGEANLLEKRWRDALEEVATLSNVVINLKQSLEHAHASYTNLQADFIARSNELDEVKGNKC